MSKRSTILFVLLALLVTAGLTAAAPAAQDDFEPNIVDIAAADDRFETLHTAIVEAGLADTLAAPGDFTVFAPTDDAFAALPAGTLDALLADPEGALTEVLLYHVVDGRLGSSAVLASDSLTTLQGGALDVSTSGGNAFVNNSQIIITDIAAKNGVIHVIDAVLVPDVSLPSASQPEMAGEAAPAGSIVDIAVADGRFETLVAAVTAADLAATLDGPGNFTVFAPTDDAFAALPAGTIDALLADPSGELTNILLYHVVGDALSANQIATDEYIPTLDGRAITVTTSEEGNVITLDGDTSILIADIQASNGVIHVIDKVLIP